jgi:hypothetical protein
MDHGRCASDAALDLDRNGRAIQEAGAAFHAGFLIRQYCGIRSWREDAVRTYFTAHATVYAFLRVVFQRIFTI